ncbi:hypothetical protein Ssi03_77560 [Sphaerisporangium siamense]|nr:hypothetical protein Ssi03_77560 [Sphaerisporangium siamense]
MFKRVVLGATGVVVAALAVTASPAAAEVGGPAPAPSNGNVSILSIPPGCSAWIDQPGNHGRGHLNCVGSGRDVRVTVACGSGGTVKRSAVGYEYAKAECPAPLGAVAVSGDYV